MTCVDISPNQLGAYRIAMNPAFTDLDMNGYDILNCPTIAGGGSSGSNAGISAIEGTPGQIYTNTVGSVATIQLVNTSVLPGTYNNANIVVDSYGRITSASNGAPQGLTAINGVQGKVTVNTAGGIATVSLASTSVAPGSYTAANITVDGDGRITAASNGVAPSLSSVLTAGNAASSDINMNGFDISAVNDMTMSGLAPTITAKCSRQPYHQRCKYAEYGDGGSNDTGGGRPSQSGRGYSYQP